MKGVFFAGAIITFGLAGCGKTVEFTDAEKSAVADSVRVMLSNYYDDIRKEGLLAEFKYLDSSDLFFWVPPGYATDISYDSVAVIIRSSAPLYKSVDNVFETLKVIPLSHELANYTGKLRSIMTDTLGHSSEFTLVETGIVIKRKSGWKLLSGQTTLVKEAVEQD